MQDHGTQECRPKPLSHERPVQQGRTQGDSVFDTALAHFTRGMSRLFRGRLVNVDPGGPNGRPPAMLDRSVVQAMKLEMPRSPPPPNAMRRRLGVAQTKKRYRIFIQFGKMGARATEKA